MHAICLSARWIYKEIFMKRFCVNHSYYTNSRAPALFFLLFRYSKLVTRIRTLFICLGLNEYFTSSHYSKIIDRHIETLTTATVNGKGGWGIVAEGDKKSATMANFCWAFLVKFVKNSLIQQNIEFLLLDITMNVCILVFYSSNKEGSINTAVPPPIPPWVSIHSDDYFRLDHSVSLEQFLCPDVKTIDTITML